MNNSKVLVTGATGLTGSHTVQLLLDHGRPVRVLAHREDQRSKRLQDLGAEVAIGDLLNLSDVRSALNGVQSAYFVYPLSPTLVHATVIFAQAAKEAGVEIVANMSQWNSRPSAKSPATINHWLSEQVFDWSAVPVAHLRPTFFCEWLLWVARSIRQGVMTMPWDANARFSPVATEDLAHVIVAILENPVTIAGRLIHSVVLRCIVLRKSQRSLVVPSVRTLRISRRVSIPSQSRLAKPAMLFSKSTAEQSRSNCKKEFSLERIRLLRRSAGGSQ